MTKCEEQKPLVVFGGRSEGVGAHGHLPSVYAFTARVPRGEELGCGSVA